MTERIVVFNGPAGSGKDTATQIAGKHLYVQGVHCTHFKMSQPIKEAVHKLYGLFYDPSYYDHGKERELKDQVHPLLFGMTLRQAYIDMTHMIQARHGAGRIGEIMANKLHNNRNPAGAFSDGGIIEEWPPIIDYLGAKDVLWIELSATKNGQALTFEGDSRRYIGDELKDVYPDLTVKRISNTITSDPLDKELFTMTVQKYVDDFFGDMYR